PAWLEAQYAQLASLAGEPGWQELLHAWVELERHFGYSDTTVGKSVTSGSRPPEIALWIKNARSVMFLPPNLRAQLFEATYWKWWVLCQLSWCSKDIRVHDAHTAPKSADWSIVKKGGKNGLLSVIMALYFWRMSKDFSPHSSWHHAVKDAEWVIRSCL
ncbi:hypothetical protein BS47DRAFT_1310793, partial [Hydnum rufescens UP504]